MLNDIKNEEALPYKVTITCFPGKGFDEKIVIQDAEDNAFCIYGGFVQIYTGFGIGYLIPYSSIQRIDFENFDLEEKKEPEKSVQPIEQKTGGLFNLFGGSKKL